MSPILKFDKIRSRCKVPWQISIFSSCCFVDQHNKHEWTRTWHHPLNPSYLFINNHNLSRISCQRSRCSCIWQDRTRVPQTSPSPLSNSQQPSYAPVVSLSWCETHSLMSDETSSLFLHWFDWIACQCFNGHFSLTHSSLHSCIALLGGEALLDI